MVSNKSSGILFLLNNIKTLLSIIIKCTILHFRKL